MGVVDIVHKGWTILLVFFGFDKIDDGAGTPFGEEPLVDGEILFGTGYFKVPTPRLAVVGELDKIPQRMFLPVQSFYHECSHVPESPHSTPIDLHGSTQRKGCPVLTVSVEVILQGEKFVGDINGDDDTHTLGTFLKDDMPDTRLNQFGFVCFHVRYLSRLLQDVKNN